VLFLGRYGIGQARVSLSAVRAAGIMGEDPAATRIGLADRHNDVDPSASLEMMALPPALNAICPGLPPTANVPCAVTTHA